MDFIKNLTPRLALIIYGAAAVTMAFFWLFIPEYSVSLGWKGTWMNGWTVTNLLFQLNSTFLGLMLLGNFVLPGVALFLSWRKKELDWLWSAITFGYFFTTGVIFVCRQGLGLTVFWYMMFLLGAAWAALAFLRRGMPASL